MLLPAMPEHTRRTQDSASAPDANGPPAHHAPGPTALARVSRRRQVSFVVAALLMVAWVVLAVHHDRLSWSLPIAAAFFALRGMGKTLGGPA